ncbi:transglutaminase family protein [Caulobacter sp. S45]|uniref:transglutaminase family protein n=1 Tax=Caulobacter sp. S45 TaxID=1641861 RepID=UPI00131D9221|nr:transglutaminase family protein [Caulobacter sp. S45]
MPIVNVRHLTRYRYRRPVTFGEHRIMFRPQESYDQRVIKSRLVIDPEPVELRYVHDVFGNCVAVARFGAPATTLTFESQVRLDHTPTALASDEADLIDASSGSFPFAYDADDMPDLLRSIERQHPDPERTLQRWARTFLRQDGPTGVLEALTAMTRAIHAEFDYAQRLYGAAQPPLETLNSKQGTCRDFAVLMMEAARALGLAARFVSGYVYDSTGPFGAGRVGGGHTHAWVRVYLPSCGWVEFDPTNGIVGNTDLIRVAIVRDPRQATPLSGAYSGASDDFLGMDVDVGVDVERSVVPVLKVA